MHAPEEACGLLAGEVEGGFYKTHMVLPITNYLHSHTSFQLDPQEQLDAFKDSLNGAIVMMGKARDWEPKFEAEAKRYSEERLAEIASAPELGKKSPWADRRKEWRARRALYRKINAFLKEENVGVVLRASEREHGTVRAYSRGGYKMNEEPGVPSILISNEQYGRIYRILEKKIP